MAKVVKGLSGKGGWDRASLVAIVGRGLGWVGGLKMGIF